jgi:Spy/CpxP family protein refolding chaperone
MKDWGVMPWDEHRLTARDIQEIRLAEHAEAYAKQEQRERQEGAQSGSVSKKHYDASKSRANAFG